MYRFKDIKEIHLEVTSKCQARCPMCPRRINGGPLNPLVDLDEIDFNTFKQWFPRDFVEQLDSVFMCGNYGDPIIANDTLEILQYLRSTNPNIRLSMHTNGSARETVWWESLADINVRVVFGIDGLADTHHLYRISTDWNKIIRNATAFINKGGIAEWHMLVFKHNEHQVSACHILSEQMGFSKFQTKHTTRFINGKFNVLDDNGKTINVLYPTEKSIMIRKNLEEAKLDTHVITCKAQKYKQIYVAANGNVSPCCWLDLNFALPNQENRIDYMDQIGKFASLKNNSIKEIFDSNFFNSIEQTWTNSPLLECSKQCGNYDKLGSQFEN